MRLEFPSPIGELHFSIRLCERRNEREKIIVSVPYRGATFLNGITKPISIVPLSFRPLSGSYISQYCSSPLSVSPMYCFRPLSGSYISQLIDGKDENGNDKFPSPIGELHFSMFSICAPSTRAIVSVPYRGATFLNTIPATPCPVWDE